MAAHSAEDHLHRAWMLYDSADFDGAEMAFTAALQINSGVASAYYGRGMVRAGLGDLSGAVADYDAAIRLNPQDVKPYLYRGFAHEKSGDTQSALADFTQALDVDLENGAAYYHRASTHERIGDTDGAIADYTQAIRSGGNYTAESYYRRGSARFRIGDYASAITDFQEALQDIDGDFVTDSLLGIANAYYAQGKHPEALKHYREYLRISGGYADSSIVQRVQALERDSHNE